MTENIGSADTIKQEFYSKIQLSEPLKPLIGKPLEKLLSILMACALQMLEI